MNNKEAGPINMVIVAADPTVRAQIAGALRGKRQRGCILCRPAKAGKLGG